MLDGRCRTLSLACIGENKIPLAYILVRRFGTDAQFRCCSQRSGWSLLRLPDWTQSVPDSNHSSIADTCTAPICNIMFFEVSPMIFVSTSPSIFQFSNCWTGSSESSNTCFQCNSEKDTSKAFDCFCETRVLLLLICVWTSEIKLVYFLLGRLKLDEAQLRLSIGSGTTS